MTQETPQEEPIVHKVTDDDAITACGYFHSSDLWSRKWKEVTCPHCMKKNKEVPT